MVLEPSLEKLWKILHCRDQSLGRASQLNGRQLSQLSEKEREIQRMASALVEKEGEIRQLAVVAAERLAVLSEQHTQAALIRERLEAMKRSFEYRLGYVLLNPWQVLKKQFFGDSNSR